ncbi:CASP-like protein 4D1 [Sesamum angolense]|uniref:CASP-like protein n=1 Tax=Sesamum angolense TaxID=2727404 RepID=A0AAE1WLB7_9LAMI|nr:CASP-like protein 4D1 [Sesamum angolense]
MATPAILNTVLFLRVFTLLALAASVVLMGINNFTEDGVKTRFTDLIAYRYVFGTGAIGFLYTLIQIPFTVYNVVKEKRLIRNGFLQEFDFYADKVMAFLLASGVGVGFGVSFELKRVLGDVLGRKSKKFLDMGSISAGILLVGFVSMALLCIISSNRRSSSSPIKGFFR